MSAVDDDPTPAIHAAEIAVGDEQYNRAEKALLEALGRVRKRRGDTDTYEQ